MFVAQPTLDHQPTRIDLGCGAHKRSGFYGIDVISQPGVDHVMDLERDKLPFPDDSIDHIYSHHMMEHFDAPGSPVQTLREMMRVAKHGSLVEIWLPHGRSDHGLLWTHKTFYTEAHWKSIVFEEDDFWFGKGTSGRFLWEKTQYMLFPGILDELRRYGIPFDFALSHMCNISMEFGVFLRVDKSIQKAPGPSFPVRELAYEHGKIQETLHYPWATPRLGELQVR